MHASKKYLSSYVSTCIYLSMNSRSGTFVNKGTCKQREWLQVLLLQLCILCEVADALNAVAAEVETMQKGNVVQVVNRGDLVVGQMQFLQGGGSYQRWHQGEVIAVEREVGQVGEPMEGIRGYFHNEIEAKLELLCSTVG